MHPTPKKSRAAASSGDGANKLRAASNDAAAHKSRATGGKKREAANGSGGGDAAVAAVEDARAMLIAKMPSITTGLLDPALAASVIGKYADAESRPLFMLAGRRTQSACQDAGQVVRMKEYIAKVTDGGVNALQPPERTYAEKFTVAQAMFTEADSDTAKMGSAEKAAVCKACPMIGLQFVAGAVLGGLGKCIEDDITKVVVDVLVPLTTQLNDAKEELEELRRELHDRDQKIARLQKEGEEHKEEEARKAKKQREEEEEEARKAKKQREEEEEAARKAKLQREEEEEEARKAKESAAADDVPKVQEDW